MMPAGLFDPQDLEHQVLFRLTTYDPAAITDDLIRATIEEQLAIITERLASVTESLEYLFRGLSGRSRDLNIHRRLELKSVDGAFIAYGEGCSFEVECKKITDEHLIELFTQKLHYIHSARSRGDAFGLYFKGDEIPWGIQTVEPSTITKQYKRDALLAHGIDPYKAVEVTRLYLLPGSPKNAISILDGYVSKYYKNLGFEAMYTTTMPTYAKTKGATTAGGMKEVLLVKELSHRFRPIEANGIIRYQHTVESVAGDVGIVETHPAFPTLYTVETFMRLNRNREIKPLEVLKSKTIFINKSSRSESIIKEARFNIAKLDDLLNSLNSIAVYKETLYLRDQFWGLGRQPKLRLRKSYVAEQQLFEVSRKYRLSTKNHIRTEVKEQLYRGDNGELAEQAILAQGKYRPENSYEKVRMMYLLGGVVLRVDIYPFGVYLEIEGSQKAIEATAARLGLDASRAITKTADETYLDWIRRNKLTEAWHVRFGLEESVDV